MALAGPAGRILGALVVALALTALMPAAAPADKTCWIPTIKGTRGPDVLRGTRGVDFIRAGRGDDRVIGLASADYVCGGQGNDTIDGGDGGDIIQGGAGDDVILGGGESDTLRGQGGEDSIDGGEAVDGCLAEVIAACETRMFAYLFPPYGVQMTGGDSTVFTMQLTVQNQGGSTATSTYAEVGLPPSAEFVPEQSSAACNEYPTDAVTCGTGFLEVGQRTDVRLALRFPACPPPDGETVHFFVSARDLYTSDPDTSPDFPPSATVMPAPSCPA